MTWPFVVVDFIGPHLKGCTVSMQRVGCMIAGSCGCRQIATETSELAWAERIVSAMREHERERFVPVWRRRS